MRDKGYVSGDRLLPIVTRSAGDFLEPESVPQVIAAAVPELKGLPSSDPLLTKLAAEICKSKGQTGAGWDDWKKSVGSDIVSYLDGLVAQCQGQNGKAISIFTVAAPKLAEVTATSPQALEAYSRLIKLRRDQGERESVAPLYLPFMELWRNPAVNEKSMGTSRHEYEARRIDDTLWAARARAQIGDGENAKRFADDVINYVNAALSQAYTLTPEQRKSMIASAAETYHLLSFRLAVEARDWIKASDIVEGALEMENLPDEWTVRLRWSHGLYHYLAGDFPRALIDWEGLLSDIEDARIKPMLLFWIAQAHDRSGHGAEALFYRKSLADDYPLSYYSIVGLELTRNSGVEGAWKKKFADFSRLRNLVAEWQGQDIEDLRVDSERGPLLRRAEIFTAVGLSSWAFAAIDELSRKIDPVTGGERAAEWGLYVSRLGAAAGHWISSISMTTRLSKDPEFWEKYPEQVLVYYPRPFVEHFAAAAKQHQVDPSMLMAISRQESSFKVDARSAANAWGLMQVTPPTAKRLIRNAGFEDPGIIPLPEALNAPDVNTKLGATFIRELKEKYLDARPPMYAAYNAGTQTVEHWMARRLVEDPLVFIELIPYQETRDYVKSVWRNELVYRWLAEKSPVVMNK
jgi:hypothetical protein